MRNRLMIIFAALCLSAGARAASVPFLWSWADNETLYGNLLTYIDGVRVEVYGEPFSFMLQNLETELKAAHKASPYAWMGQTARFCNKVQAIYPAALAHSGTMVEDKYEHIRKCIVMLRDYPLHESTFADSEDGCPAPPAAQVSAFNAANRQSNEIKRDEFFAALALPAPADGAIQIVKVYNEGYIFRAAGYCFGVDICYGEGFYSNARKEELASMLDALFLTHGHGDHYDLDLMRMMCKLGKPVILPKDVIPDTSSEQKKVFPEGMLTPQSWGPLTVQAAMSAQGTEPNLLYHIKVGDWVILHIGDNSIHANEVFYEDKEPADIVIGPVFQGVPDLISHTMKAPGIEEKAHIYFTGHENEFHHNVVRRVSYRYFYQSALRTMKQAWMPYYCPIEGGQSIILTK